MPKFKVGDKVTYRRMDSTRNFILKRVTINEIVEFSGKYKMATPLYHISWPPTGKACVYESQLS